ncbi:hypothetical protein MnTg01_00764 [archaeon MnTg01]|nr:hypothetical protein MnTg01_00764 [archaeon MnTg01]
MKEYSLENEYEIKQLTNLKWLGVGYAVNLNKSFT